VTGIPTQDPFLWRNGKMIDLGTLGGTNGVAIVVNSRGQVAGQSNLAGDLTFHPFLWDNGVLTDLGTLGGDAGLPLWINDAGDVVGAADLAGSQTADAFLWANGVMTDLGNLGADSFANAVNSERQVVGASQVDSTTMHAFLWEKGGPMADLNSLIPTNSSLQLANAYNINERGEISGIGAPAGCGASDAALSFCGHAFLLIPCDENHPGVEGCDYDTVDAETAAQARPAQITESSAPARGAKFAPTELMTRSRAMARRNQRFGTLQK